MRVSYLSCTVATFQCFTCVQDRKVFTVCGPYPSLRAALRRRGWVEKINGASALTEATRLSANGNSRFH